MTTRVCSVDGCPTLFAKTTDGRCPEHRKQAGRERSRRRPELKVYGSPAHRRFRAAVLRRDPSCVLCGAPATVADHHPLSMVELLHRGTPFDDPDRGRGLCASCHGRETARLQPGGWNAS